MTTFSVVTANGVSAVVANPTTTPAATFTLGNITPTNVVITDTVSAGSGSLTGSAFTVNQTWNTSGNPSGIFENVTKTAVGSATSSYLIRLQVNSTDAFRVDASTDATFGTAMYLGAYKLNLINGALNLNGALYFNGGNAGSQFSSTQWSFGNGSYAAGVVSIGDSNLPASPALFVSGSTSQSTNIICVNKAYGTSSSACDAATLSKDGNYRATSVGSVAVTVANLPATPVEGMIVAVTDALAATHGITVTGGGSVHVLVYYNGTNWIVQ